MPPRYKKRRIPSDDDEEYEPNMDESDDEDDGNEQNKFMQNIQMTSSGRLIRPSKIKKEPRNGSEEFANVLDNILLEENTSNLKPQSGGLKRIKVHDMDKTYAPDLSKISRYLMAVKRTYANSKNKLAVEEERRFESNEPTLARLLAANENDELNRWKRVDEISPSLARWLGTKSISLVVHGTVPIDVLERGENGNVDLERRPLPTKIQMKRGRPRKDESDKQKLATDVDSKKKKREVPPAKLIDKTPITVNERLKSLVDESIARCSVAREQPTFSPRRGRRTNNSLAIALSQQPSTSSTPMQSTEQTTTSSSPFPQLKKIKLEIEDFTLPSEFSTGLKNHRFSIPSSTKMPFPSTSKQTLPISKQQITNGEQLPLSDSPKKKNLNSTFLTTKNSQNVEKKVSSSKGNAEIYLPIKIEDSAKINRLALFKAQTFKFDVDRSPAVQNYESVQVVDIFHTLPTPGIVEENEQINQPAISNVQMDSIATKADQISTRRNSSGETSMSTIDRLVLRQGKKPSQFAQALFCGGPLAAISVCPNALLNGHEFIAIATFADEKSLEWPENDTNSYLQMWNVNPNELNEPAKMAFLLRVSNVVQICSLTWCPSLKDPSSNKTASSLSMPSTSSAIPLTSISPLGLLAIGTNNGRILIYRIPRQLDQFLSRQQQIPSPIQSSIILETLPFLTLHHPKISVSIANSASRPIMSDSIPIFSLKWSPFVGARHIAAISASGSIYIWDILQNEPKFPRWSLNLEERQPPPTTLSWMESDKICITSRHRQLRVYKLLLNNSPTNQQNSSSLKLVSECDTTKSVGAQCCTSPLIFPGLISFDSIGFNYFGNIQQAPCYIWAIDKGNSEQICGTNLSNCHQIRLSALSVCPQSGICASIGADGRLVCSLNGRMSPRDGLQREMEVFIHGRTLLQLISHNKRKVEANNEDEENMENEIDEDKPKFCYSHEDCCAEKLLEIRLGDCALLEQKNERACGRRAPEICLDRRLESLTAVDFSHNTVGLTFCGGDSGLVFIVPCTL